MSSQVKTKIGEKLKDYMNAEESNYFLYLLITSEHMQEYRERLARYGNITKDEHKFLKMSETYMKKYVKSVQARLSSKQKKFFKDKSKKRAIKIIDAWTEKRLYGQWGDEMRVVKLPRSVYENWCSEIMSVKCKNCTQSHNECKLHDYFIETFVPEADGYDKPNCRYAYD